MTITKLFRNIREHLISVCGQDAVAFTPHNTDIDSIDESESVCFNVRDRINSIELNLFSRVLTFTGSVEFEVPLKKRRNCTKGYSCGRSCISPLHKCRNPLEGQARSYASWLEKQPMSTLLKSTSTKSKVEAITEPEPTPNKNIDTSDVPKTQISSSASKKVAVKKLLLGSEHTENVDSGLADSILQNGVQSPVVAERKGDKYKVIAGHKMAAALVQAAKIDPLRGETGNVFVANNKEESDALKYQMKFIKEPLPKNTPPIAESRDLGKQQVNHGNNDKLGEPNTVAIKRIKGETGTFPFSDIEKLATSQLRVGNILPVVVKRDGSNFELVHGGLAVAAARRAAEIDPKAAENLRVFIANDDKEANALKYQVGEEKLPAQPPKELKTHHFIKTQKDFEHAVNQSINDLEDKHNKLIPIPEIRRSLGNSVSRSDFDSMLKKMQSEDKVQLQGGSFPLNSKYNTRDAVVSNISGLRTHLSSFVKKDEREVNENVNAKVAASGEHEPLLGLAEKYQKGKPIKGDKEVVNHIQSFAKDYAADFPSEVLSHSVSNPSVIIPKAEIHAVFGSRLSHDLSGGLGKTSLQSASSGKIKDSHDKKSLIIQL